MQRKRASKKRHAADEEQRAVQNPLVAGRKSAAEREAALKVRSGGAGSP